MAKSDLANYVAHRRAMLDLIEDALKATPNGGYRREEVMHSIVFPRGKQTGDVGVNQHRTGTPLAIEATALISRARICVLVGSLSVPIGTPSSVDSRHRIKVPTRAAAGSRFGADSSWASTWR